VSYAVMLYDHGIVMDEKDMQRFVRTQMSQVWDGNMENPKFFRIDRSEGTQSGDYIAITLSRWDDKLREFAFEGRRQQARLEAASHGWQGGPGATGWIREKYIVLPAAEGGRRLQAEVAERFAAKPENRELVERLKFEVTGRGYVPPRTPAEWPDMPDDPGRQPAPALR
jgi:hypothetical protein